MLFFSAMWEGGKNIFRLSRVSSTTLFIVLFIIFSLATVSQFLLSLNNFKKKLKKLKKKLKKYVFLNNIV